MLPFTRMLRRIPMRPKSSGPGQTPAISTAIADALHGAGVSYHEHMRDVGLLPGLSQPVYMIMIHARDHNAAQTALENARSALAGARLDSDAAERTITDSISQGAGDKPLEADDCSMILLRPSTITCRKVSTPTKRPAQSGPAQTPT